MNNELKGKVVSGYQAWFRASSALDKGWIHWSRGQSPAMGKPTFEMFPDIQEYPDDVIFPSGYPHLADGREAKLFSSRTAGAIDLHFSWAKDYGIDCLALQRFYSEIVPERQASHYDKDHLTLVKNAAEKHGRMFYIMYDFSGAARHEDAVVAGCTQDWMIQVEEAGLLDSPNYACYNGKKIVCLWGLTGLDQWRYPSAKNALALIQWFKQRGYYVIGGFPDNNWALVTDDYAAVYQEVDMISPWVVGRFGPGGVEDWWKPVFEREREYCKKHDKAYMPVAFPGFAWCSFNGGAANMIPRQSGRFFWDQVNYLHAQGIENIYLAMFDEYDEGTAFMKAAEDSSQIPMGDSYFQTLSVDGYWLSSDYYLRLAGAAGALLRGEQPPSALPPVAHAIGPVYWRNGFEKRNYLNLDTKEMCTATVDVGLFEDCPLQGDIRAEIRECSFGTGKYALYIQGTGTYKMASTKIHCTKPLVFTYAASTDCIKVGVILDDGRCQLKASGEVFTAESKICGIAVSITGGEGFVDDIVLKEAK